MISQCIHNNKNRYQGDLAKDYSVVNKNENSVSKIRSLSDQCLFSEVMVQAAKQECCIFVTWVQNPESLCMTQFVVD